jgi:prevent-host-death family protein
MMTVATLIPVRDLRNHTAEIAARVEAGEIIHVTVHGRPALELRPITEADPVAWLDDLVGSGVADSGWLDELAAERASESALESTQEA